MIYNSIIMPLPNFLYDRYKDWIESIFPEKKKLLESLAKNGQKPQTMIISCCDSRVDPTNIFRAEFGDIFIYRNIANLVPPFNQKESGDGTFSAIEYAIKSLGIKDLIILGHSGCGGIQHAQKIFSSKQKKNDLSIDKWCEHIKPAYEMLDKNQTKEEQLKSLEKLSIINSISNIFSSKDIKNNILINEINIHGLWFEISTGKIYYYNKKKNFFESLL